MGADFPGRGFVERPTAPGDQDIFFLKSNSPRLSWDRTYLKGNRLLGASPFLDPEDFPAPMLRMFGTSTGPTTADFARLTPPQSERLGATLSIPLETRVNELGLLETALYAVTHHKENPLISRSICWLSAADEEDESCWIGYYDQVADLEQGYRIRARKGSKEFQEVDARQVKYMDAEPLQQFSLAARLIPFIQHDDANRVLMACSAMRQALPLVENEPPLIHTGYDLAFTEDEATPRTYGRNLLVAYMPFHGLNFEDAVVVSESAAKKLRSVRRYEYEIALREYSIYLKTKVQGKNKKKDKPIVRRWELNTNLLRSAHSRRHLGNNGIVREGAWVEPGDVLVGIEDPYQRSRISINALAIRSQEGKRINPWDHSLTVPPGEKGQVTEVRIFSTEKGDHLPSGTWQLVRVTVERQLPLEVGDKLTNRHGGKGVVSAIFKDEEMPWFMDPLSTHDHGGIGPHIHVELIMNPLGVISRLNLGQLYETHLGWIAKRSNRDHLKVDVFSDSLRFLKNENIKVENNPATDGKVVLHDPGVGIDLERPVTVGYAYILRLHHLAGEKVHGRGYARFKYSAMSEQPLKGKKKRGGQRLGEMEIWALEAYNVRNIIQEVLTLKSDNPWMREWLYQAQREQSSISDVKPEPPEMLRVLTLFLMALRLRLDFLDAKGTSLPLVGTKGVENPDQIHCAVIRPLSDADVKSIAIGEVTEAEIGTEALGYNDKGLLSQPIFGPLTNQICKCGTVYQVGGINPERCQRCNVEIAKRDIRRHRMGYIELVYPVFNVVFLDVAGPLLGVSRLRMKELLKENPEVPILRFQEPLDFFLFFWLAMNGSSEFRVCIEKRLDLQFTEDQRGFHHFKATLGNNWLNRLNALPSIELFEGFSAIELIGKVLEALTTERLEEMRGYLISELNSLKEEEKDENRQKQLIRRLDVVSLFLQSRFPPSDMMIHILPVLPTDLRRPYGLSTGREAYGELNELYKDVIFANNTVKGAKGRNQNKKDQIRKLQQRVSALIDNERSYPPSFNTVTGRRFQQSLAYFIKGKKGFFRANLLGKRVDYSGRSVIVPDPDLHLNQCGLPYTIAVEIFMPVLIRELRDRWRPRGKKSRYTSLSDRTIEARIKKTLKTIPMILSPGITFGTEDTDKKEVENLLNRIGQDHPVLMNRQPTLHRLGIQAFYFKINDHNAISMHPLVTAGFNADFDGDTIAIHRLITREAIDEADGLLACNNLFSPANGSLTLNLGQDVALGAYLQTFTDEGRKVLKNHTGFEVKALPLDCKAFGAYLRSHLQYYRDTDKSQAVAVVDSIKTICFKKVSTAGITLSIFDMPDLSKERDELRSEEGATNQMDRKVEERLNDDPSSALTLIYGSGAKGDIRTIRQLVAMRGEMERIAEEGGKVASSIVWSSLREGMSQGEFFVSSYGSRTTLVDKKMGTADAGYVTRQLVEMAQRYRITQEDCVARGQASLEPLEIGPHRYVWLDVKDWNENALIKRLFEERHFVSGLLWDISNQQTDSPYSFQEINRVMDKEVEDAIRKRDPIKQLLGIKIRETRSLTELVGKLFGRTLVTPVQIDDEKETLGFVVDREEYALQLAQQILKEERTFLVRSPLTCHASDGICQRCYGLDLSTGKPPEIGAKVGIIAAQSIGEPGTQLVLRTFHSGGVMGMAGISKDIPKVQRFLNANSLSQLEATTAEILSAKAYPLLIDGIKDLYLKNKVEVADPHFEILLKAMLSKMTVEAPSDNRLFTGQILERSDLQEMSEPKAQAHQIFCGINLFSRHPTSWLAAASFGGTLNALAFAAAGGRKDALTGLKENVILGRRLP